MNITFACANCGASLKVLKKFGGKSIQCPKCVKKTLVPAVAEPAPAAPVQTVPASPAPAPAVKAEPAPAAAPLPAAPREADPAVAARLKQKEEEARVLARRVEDLETQVEVARLRAEKAERDMQALRDRKTEDREKLKAELTAHYQTELTAARVVIAQLEAQIRDLPRGRGAAGEPDRSAARIEKEMLESGAGALMEKESAASDAVMAEIRNSGFGRFLRGAIAVHLVVLLLSSIGLLVRHFRGPAPEEAAPAGETAAADTGTNVAPASASTQAVQAVSVPKPAQPATNGAAARPATPAETPKTATELELEALPLPGEEPPAATEIDLKL